MPPQRCGPCGRHAPAGRPPAPSVSGPDAVQAHQIGGPEGKGQLLLVHLAHLVVHEGQFGKRHVVDAVPLLAAVGGGYALSQKSKAEQVVVPDVTNHTLQEATGILEQYGLGVGSVSYQTSETVEKDLVIYQDPTFNSSLEKGAKVNLTISQGKGTNGMVSVPNLMNLTEEQALSALEAQGLLGSSSEGYSDTVEAGKVYEQTQAAMSEVPKGTTIQFKVSLGKKESNVPIADYYGQNAEEVKADLEAQGLKVTLKDGYSNSVSVGDVMEQSIAGGTSVAAGSSITLTVCRGKQQQEETTVPVPNVTGMSESKATSKISSAGLKYSVSYESGENGKVISQSPSGGSVKKGSTVKIVVGTGYNDGE